MFKEEPMGRCVKWSGVGFEESGEISKEQWGGLKHAAKQPSAVPVVSHDALKDAARLALDALYAVLHDCDDIDMVESNEPGRDVGPWQLSNDAIAALKAVL